MIYSHSRLSTFEQCPFKFKLKYLDKIKPEIESSIEAHLGSCVHDALEWLYLKIRDRTIPKIDDIITYYHLKWEENYKPNILVVRNHLTPKDYFNKGVIFLTQYYLKHQPFQDGTLEVEKKVIVDLNRDGRYKMQGFIDRLVHNKKRNRYEIHDYKTANTLPTQEKIDGDRQLALYSIAIKDLFGYDQEVSLIWHYLAHNIQVISRRTNNQLEQLKREIIELIDEIEATKEFHPKKSVLCSWCEYKTMCPMFGGIIGERQKFLDISSTVPRGNNINKEDLEETELDIW